MPSMQRVRAYRRLNPRRGGTLFTLLAVLVLVTSAGAQQAEEFRRTVMVSTADPVTLDIDLPRADLEILYSREGQVSIRAQVRDSGAGKIASDFLITAVHLVQEGNHLVLRQTSDSGTAMNVLYRLDVPYRTAVVSHLRTGKQTISGIIGPVKANNANGDIKASYIAGSVEADTDAGNVDLAVIGEHALAKVGEGNISCTRLLRGVTAEAENGDITLMVVGPSTATVKKGRGEIEVGGARGSFVGTTVSGDIHMKAVPHHDWQLFSESGDIRMELPAGAAFELYASGMLRVERDDIQTPAPELRRVHQNINGGGHVITADTGSGRIVIR